MKELSLLFSENFLADLEVLNLSNTIYLCNYYDSVLEIDNFNEFSDFITITYNNKNFKYIIDSLNISDAQKELINSSIKFSNLFQGVNYVKEFLIFDDPGGLIERTFDFLFNIKIVMDCDFENIKVISIPILIGVSLSNNKIFYEYDIITFEKNIINSSMMGSNLSYRKYNNLIASYSVERLQTSLREGLNDELFIISDKLTVESINHYVNLLEMVEI